jgi:hypothetical protein
MRTIHERSKYVTKFTPESGLLGQFFMFLKAITSGLKGVLINFVTYFDLSNDEI